jgi:GT2 family glycosyltransferase
MSATPIIRPITVVVPVYGDLESLTDCIQSLRNNVDQSTHRVLLVNDCGPDADAMEASILSQIDAEPAFFYERNPQNLGFVGNCNRAVFELDKTDNDVLLLNSDTVTTPGFLEELSMVLNASPSHGAVCARSNNATIASIPFKLRDPAAGRSTERTAEVHAAVKDVLPQFTVAPVAMGFCILIRRNLIREYGLFDEIYAPGYGEENDFCLRIAQHGFASVIAHRALVFHMGARSFVGARREALRSAHEKIVVGRYPSYTGDVQAYIHQKRDPVDVFADAMVPGDDVVRLLIDIDDVAGARLTQWDERMLAGAAGESPGTVVTVAVPDSVYRRVVREHPQLRIVRQAYLDGQWDVAVARLGSASPTQLARLNRTCLRWVSLGSDSTGLADALLDESAVRPQDVVGEAARLWGRAVVDPARLRSRWLALTVSPEFARGAASPRESRRVGLLRRAEAASPRAVGWAKSTAKSLLGRQ